MRILTGTEVSSLLRDLTSQDARRLRDSLSSGLAAYTKQEQSSKSETKLIHQPPRPVIQTKDHDTTLVMPVSNTSTTSVKVVTVPRNGDIQGAITIYSPLGVLQGVLNAAEITAFRTALATMTILTRWKAPDALNVVVFGAVFATLREAYPEIEFEGIATANTPAQVGTRLVEADIISCCTPSTEPLFTAKELQHGSSKSRFMSLIGSYKPSMQEIDSATLKLAVSKILVDSKAACLEEAGELVSAGLGPDDLIEIGELFSKDPNGDENVGSEDALTIFKCVGFGLMDLIVSQALLEMAEDAGTGTVLDGF
ncbi:hypothetical protein LTR37_012736 [Vermiconidia calcicola]|uniref:Uncharacterized protein n=1 Tax=Vermiconidia calcicola TaxID=1690605 RepID=A0ACC3MYE1_9PEZI|nr:hypothetical protein LTR37_012736 [Vermiconidia calcicola]